MKKTIEISILNEHPSMKDALKYLTGESDSFIKKNFPRKLLQKSIRDKDLLKIPIDFLNRYIINPTYVGPKLEVIYEDENFLALNKPGNVHIHPLSYDDNNNCLSYLRANGLCACLQVNKSGWDRGLLYRLDYETSGVIVLAKSDDIYQTIRNKDSHAFSEKVYLAKVEGNFNAQGEHHLYFKNTLEKGKKVNAFVEEVKGARVGELSVEKLSYNKADNFSLIKIYLKTGVKHQIRSTMSYLGFPILGDTLYGGKESFRLYLHALNYKIAYKNRSYSFETSSPNDW